MTEDVIYHEAESQVPRREYRLRPDIKIERVQTERMAYTMFADPRLVKISLPRVRWIEGEVKRHL